MKQKAIVITLFLSIFVIGGYAQEKKKFDLKAYQTEKENIIKREANLTAKESDAFFPIYHEMSKKRFEVNREVRNEMKRLMSAANASDAEYQKVIEAQIKAKEKEATIEREYFEKFKKILPIEKVFKVSVAEAKMNREILKKYDKSKRRK